MRLAAAAAAGGAGQRPGAEGADCTRGSWHSRRHFDWGSLVWSEPGSSRQVAETSKIMYYYLKRLQYFRILFDFAEIFEFIKSSAMCIPSRSQTSH